LARRLLIPQQRRESRSPSWKLIAVELLADPDRQIQGKCIAIVQIGQNREFCLGFGFKSFDELLAVRHEMAELIKSAGWDVPSYQGNDSWMLYDFLYQLK
jgi:hypothetical protein